MATDPAQDQGMDPAGVNLPLIGQDEIQRRRALAQAMMARGADYSPVQSWTQGAARLADAAAGAYGNYSAGKLEQQMNQSDLRALAPYLGGGATNGSPTPLPTPSPLPPTAPPPVAPTPPAPTPTIPPPEPVPQATIQGTPGFSMMPIPGPSTDESSFTSHASAQPANYAGYGKKLDQYGNPLPGSGLPPDNLPGTPMGGPGRAKVAQAMQPRPFDATPPGSPGQSDPRALLALAVRGGRLSPIAAALLAKRFEPQKPIVMGQGSTAIDPISHKVIFSAPERPEAGMIRTPEGGESFIPGGSKDPATIAATSGARQRGATEALENTDEVSNITEGIKNGDQPPVTTGLYRVGPAVRARLEKEGVDISKMQLQWDAAKKQINTLNGPQLLRFTTAARSVVNTIDEVKRLASEMKNTGVPLYNRVRLLEYIEAEGNSPKGQLGAQYVGAVNTLKEEFAQLAQGGGVPTEPAWQLANQQIRGDYGINELGASLDEIRRLINYRIQAIPGQGTFGPGAANQYTGATGQPPEQLSPQTSSGGEWTTLPDGTRIRQMQ